MEVGSWQLKCVLSTNVYLVVIIYSLKEVLDTVPCSMMFDGSMEVHFWYGMHVYELQVIVQRALAGKTYDHAKAGTILCAYIKVLPLFMLVFPGMIARVLFPGKILGWYNVCSHSQITKQTYHSLGHATVPTCVPSSYIVYDCNSVCSS